MLGQILRFRFSELNFFSLRLKLANDKNVHRIEKNGIFSLQIMSEVGHKESTFLLNQNLQVCGVNPHPYQTDAELC